MTKWPSAILLHQQLFQTIYDKILPVLENVLNNSESVCLLHIISHTGFEENVKMFN